MFFQKKSILTNWLVLLAILMLLLQCIDSAVLPLPPFSNQTPSFRAKNDEFLSFKLGLYNESDRVMDLNQRNFEMSVLNQNHSILMEFYNSYCGHCKRFAPFYKELAEKLYSWRDILPIGAIDCAADENNGICREYEIMAYPTLRYFGPNYSPKKYQDNYSISNVDENPINNDNNNNIKYGIPIDLRDFPNITSILVEFLLKENPTPNMTNWPQLQPLQHINQDNQGSNDKNEINKFFQQDNKYTIIIYTSMPASNASNTATSYYTLGPEITLHFTRWPDIRISYTSDLKLAQSYADIIDGDKVKMAAIEKLTGKVESIPLNIGTNSKDDTNTTQETLNVVYSYVQAIKDYFEKTVKLHQITEIPEVIRNRFDLNENEHYTRDDQGYNLRELIDEVKRNKHFIYQADIEISIKTILQNEIAKTSNISGEKLLALQKFLTILVRYNPLSWNEEGSALIRDISTFVQQNNERINGAEYDNELHRLLLMYPNAFRAKYFVGCMAVKAGSRGFTCSLWQLFHYLTVLASNSNFSQDPLEILDAIHGYIKHFFGCTDCSKHFQNMAEKREMRKVADKNQAVLWLWAAHNQVNRRLAGDSTEDPEFPKIQFPTVDSCPLCHQQRSSINTSTVSGNGFTSNSIPKNDVSVESAGAISSQLSDDSLFFKETENWNHTHVLQFLKNIYNRNYLSRYGIPKTPFTEQEDDQGLVKNSAQNLRTRRMVANMFSEIDIRMGMLLYGFCILMMGVAFKLFAFKSNFRRKMFFTKDNLGKV